MPVSVFLVRYHNFDVKMWREQKPCRRNVRQLTIRPSILISLLIHNWSKTPHTAKWNLWVYYLRKVRTRFKVVSSQKLFTIIFKESFRRENVNAPRIAGTFFGSTTRCTTAIYAANFLPSDWLYSLWHGINWRINGYCMNAIYIFSYVTLNSVKRFHSYGLHLCKVIGAEGRFYIGKSLNSHGNG